MGEESFSEGQVLYAKDQPKYFETILSEKFIVAPDAHSHPTTATLTNQYFVLLDIYSLLYFVIYRDFKPSGIICCENAGERHEWNEDDISFLRQISTLVSFNYKSN